MEEVSRERRIKCMNHKPAKKSLFSRDVRYVAFNANVLSAEQIVNLFNTGGFGIGVGEWRPQKDGPFGRFHVATTGE